MSRAATSQTVEPYPLYAQVALEGGIDKLLDYGVPPELVPHISEGMRVRVPVRSQLKTGMIISLAKTPSFPRVAPIAEVLSEPLLSKELFQLAEWIAHYYCSSLRKVLKFMIPSPVREKIQPKEQLYISCLLPKETLLKTCAEIRQKHPSQAKVLETFLVAEKNLLLSELLEKAKVSKSPVETLIKQRILEAKKLFVDALEEEEYFLSQPKPLSTHQKLAYDRIISSLQKKIFQVHLLHGVTGSGKTEVYLQAIQRVIEEGGTALMLVPEVALTSQMIERFRSRFQKKIGVYHYRLSAGQRYALWNDIAQGKIQIVLGARSAVLLPLQNLQLIIVDEEHETSYKQSEEAPCYHARDVAIMRGSFCKATVVLGSATPSLESYYNAKQGKYLLSELPSRATQALLPKISIVNMLLEREKSEGFTFFAPKLLDAIASRIKEGEQTLLFLNRRGYHSLLLCKSCHAVHKCTECDVALTFHQKTNSLECHYCDYRLSPPPKSCTHCGKETLLYRGIGTEQVEASLKRIFPSVRTLRMDADTTRHKGSHERLFKEFKAGKADVLIGTQMIAKGFHFPSVTLVGVLNADQALHTGDFRASEHLFQLLVQVSGRAGRGQLPGEVLIQTMLPEHPLFSLVAKENYLEFYTQEIASRELFHYPPFTHLAKLTFSSPLADKTFDKACFYHTLLMQNLPPSYTLLPVIPDRILKVQGRYKYYFMIKGPSMGPLSRVLKKCFDKHPLTSSFQVLIEIDS